MAGSGRSRRPVRFYQIANTGESAGLTDVVFMRDNEIWFCEVKAEGGRLRESQQRFFGLLDKYGMENQLICYSWEELYEFIKEIGPRKRQSGEVPRSTEATQETKKAARRRAGESLEALRFFSRPGPDARGIWSEREPGDGGTEPDEGRS